MGERNGQLDLRFMPGSPAGFTPAGIAAFDDLRPAAIVRELIQNSIDAAVEAGEETAIVRFQLDTCALDELPGIEAYKRAFLAALKFQEERGGFPSKARRVADTIAAALDKTEVDMLSVLDNGMGLDERRMEALLSDGVSIKSGSGSTGTYGNGHSVPIPTSDLRYALYGGVTRAGLEVSGGHAVLASHSGDSQLPLSGDGFLVCGFGDGAATSMFQFAQGGDIPPFIQKRLEDIEEASGHGAAVILPAFNFFREKRRSFGETVLKAAACNFFAAIHEEQLEVWVEDPAGEVQELTLDASNLADTLAECRDQKRAQAFLSGARAYDAYSALRFGASEEVQTQQGAVWVSLHKGTEKTHVDLCRNGMWITDDKKTPGFYYKFGDRSPFHAVLLLDRDGGNLHELVRNAEGPLHDAIRLKDLSKADANDLRSALAEVRDWLLDHTDEISGESFDVDDFLVIEGDEVGGKGQRGVGGYRGVPSIIRRRVPGHAGGLVGRGKGRHKKKRGSGKTNLDRPRRTSVLPPAYQAVSLPLPDRRFRVTVTCAEARKNAMLRLRVNENVDATCDSLWHEIVPVVLKDVQRDGQPVDDADLVWNDEDVVGVRLGSMKRGATVNIETGYRTPDAFGSWRGSEPSLWVEVVEGAPVASEVDAS